MKKVLTSLLSIAMLVGIISPSSANDQKVVAIIDTAITSHYSNNIIHEVCIVGNSSCPNNTPFMEGIGSAQLSGNDLKLKGIDHGQQVTSVAINTNPNIKIVFIRITSINRYPTFTATHTDGAMLGKALDWVSNNYAKFSIDAVSISQARINFNKGTCPKDAKFESEVQELKSANIPVFAGVGNWSKIDHTAFPACVTDVIGVGAVDSSDNAFWFTHHGIGVDFYTLGKHIFNSPSLGNTYAIGTSMATPALAVKWVDMFNGTYSEQTAQANSVALKKIDNASKFEMKIIK